MLGKKRKSRWVAEVNMFVLFPVSVQIANGIGFLSFLVSMATPQLDLPVQKPSQATCKQTDMHHIVPLVPVCCCNKH